MPTLAEILASGSDAEKLTATQAQENARRTQFNALVDRRASELEAALKAMGLTPLIEEQTAQSSWLQPNLRFKVVTVKEYPQYSYGIPTSESMNWDADQIARYMISNSLRDTYGGATPSADSLKGLNAAGIQSLLAKLTPQNVPGQTTGAAGSGTTSLAGLVASGGSAGVPAASTPAVTAALTPTASAPAGTASQAASTATLTGQPSAASRTHS